MSDNICGKPNPGGLFCRFPEYHITAHSWEPQVIPEPVPKPLQAMFVRASQNLMWLTEHGGLEQADGTLAHQRANLESIEAAAAREARQRELHKISGTGPGDYPAGDLGNEVRL